MHSVYWLRLTRSIWSSKRRIVLNVSFLAVSWQLVSLFRKTKRKAFESFSDIVGFITPDLLNLIHNDKDLFTSAQSIASNMASCREYWSIVDFVQEFCTEYWFKYGILHYEIEMKAVHPLKPWFFLRTTCRKMIRPCIIAMAYRLVFLKSPNFEHESYLRKTQVKRMDRIVRSGWLMQLWLPDDSSIKGHLQRRGLLFDSETLRPIMMELTYWEELRQRVGNDGHGWVNGKLQLWSASNLFKAITCAQLYLYFCISALLLFCTCASWRNVEKIWKYTDT